MLCRLCVEECTEFKELYDENGKQNDIYRVCVKYFRAELGKLELDENIMNSNRIICKTCWNHISDFNRFDTKIKAAQEKLNELLPFEEVIKLEHLEPEVTFYDPTAVIDETKTDIEEQPQDALVTVGLTDTLNELKIENDNDSSSGHSISCSNEDEGDDEDEDDDEDDDKPLAKILINKTRKRKSALKDDIKAYRKKRGRPRKKNEELDENKKECAKNNEKSIQKRKTAEHDKFISDWKQVLPCEICDFGSTNFTKLREHFRVAHNSNKPYVTCCDKKYNNRFHLVEHIRVHLDPEIFKCPECGKCSANSRSLATHIKSVHGPEKEEKPYQCDVCEKRFAKKAVLQGHMDIHATGQKDHICPHCGKGFVLEHKLKIHIRNIHCAACVCEQCGKSFRNSYSLKDHLLEHEGIRKPKWPCDLCPAQLNTKYSLLRHKRIAHHDGSTLYVCGECGKVALNEGALLSHKKNVHQRPRKFKCTICDKAFKVAQVLREHMTIHTGEELYKCPHCPKTFRVSANMHHHRKRVHPKEWAEKRNQRPYIPSTDMSQVSQKVVL